LIREKSPRLQNAKGPKNTFRELVAEKRLKYLEREVVHHAAGTNDLVIHFPSAEWSTVQRVRVTVQWVRASWRFTFPPVALYKQTGRCELTTRQKRELRQNYKNPSNGQSTLNCEGDS
jgi:hypothetical protein